DPVFIAAKAANAGNRALFADYTSAYGESADYAQGFKEFFTVKEVKLYAYNSVLSALPDSEIQWLINQNLIGFEGDYVTFTGLQIDLKKNTMGKYLSFYVNVIDSFATSQTTGTRLRIAVNVTNNASKDGISARDNRATTPNYNTRPNNNYPLGGTYGGSTYRENTGDSSVVFNFRMRKGETVRISPYDLFYSNDTFGVNGANNHANKDGAESGYNTVPGTSAYTELMGGVNKNIAVYVADTPSATPAQKSDFHLDRLKISVTNPQVSGGGTNGTVMPSGTDYFEITAIRKTTGSSYMSFYYEVVSDSGESIRAEIRVYVDNSLPEKRVAENKVFYLSATPTLGNSSSSEVLSGVLAENGNSFYVINEETYNIREFTLDDLFEDVDGDNVIFVDSTSITVGTKDKSGKFVAFGTTGYGNNEYIRAYVGAGSGVRGSNNSCLIIEGLSSTQGVPGGVWVQFRVSDNAIGTNASTDNIVYEFQVEVVNSTPLYAEMTGDNAMENKATAPDAKPQYEWKKDSQVSAVMEAVNNGTGTGAGIVANQKVYLAKLFETGDVNSPDGSLAVETEKPIYIAANSASMGYYKDAVNAKLNGTGLAFNYTNEQVRYIAQDADQNQGLALWGYGYKGQTANSPNAPSFRVHSASSFAANATVDDLFSGEANANNAVAITRMYRPTDFPTSASEQAQLNYYKENNIVQIFFFNEKGDMINTTSTATDADRLAANQATNWVIAFNFVGKPTESSFDVRIRLRDVNNAVVSDPDKGTITTGGFSEFSNTLTLYKGPRTFVNNNGTWEYGAATANVTGLANGDGVFGFTAVHKTQGLINNFSYWSSTDTKTGVSYP
ncbi:MAG: hypothetical protein K2L51_06040, partial [Clostridiales bacterium]|nr:hypothetical protein [Clostridiales bacterium]